MLPDQDRPDSKEGASLYWLAELGETAVIILLEGFQRLRIKERGSGC